MKLEQIEKKAKEVKEVYDYMNTMPLEGWFWEIIRRSPAYMTACKELLEAWQDAEKRNSDFPALLKKLEGLGLGINSGFLGTRLNHKLGFSDDYDELMEKNFYLFRFHPLQTDDGGELEYGDGAAFHGVPNPERAYVDFERCQKPLIHCKAVLDVTYDELMTVGYGAEGQAIPIDEILNSFSIGGNPGKTFYLAVSKTAPLNQIEEEIGAIIREHVVPRQTKIRAFDKWKFYMMAYDLSQSHPAREIADLLLNAFPDHDVFFDEQTIVNYQKNARHLLAGEYKKYLFIQK